MSNRTKLAELTGHGVTLAVELVEEENHLRYEISGPQFRARLPHCGCDRPGCAGGDGGAWRRCKLETAAGARYEHGRQFCHGSRWAGYHEEHAVKFARAVFRTYRNQKHKPGLSGLDVQDWLNPNDTRNRGAWMQLDGEELVDLYPLRRRTVYRAESETVAARVVCTSPRCVVNGRGWSRIVVLMPGTEYDPGRAAYPGGPVADAPRVEGRDPYEVRNEHLSYHRETFGVHPRVVLDRWVRDHAMAGAPEPDRAELDRQLAIATAERKAGAR